MECTSLEHVYFNSKLKHIGSAAFCECSALKEITILDCITEVDNLAFSDCISLETVFWGSGAAVISENTFANCSSLKKLYLGSSVTAIENGAFLGCRSLEGGLFIPGSVRRVGSVAFAECVSLTSVSFSSPNISVHPDAFACCSADLRINDFGVKSGTLYIADQPVASASERSRVNESEERAKKKLASLKDRKEQIESELAGMSAVMRMLKGKNIDRCFG